MSNVRMPANLESRDIDEIISAAVGFMESSKDALENDVVDVCAQSNYNNRAADDFFQIVVNVFAYGAEQAEAKRLDPFDNRTFESLVESGVNMAFAISILEDRQLSRDCSRDEIDDLSALKEDYDVIVRAMEGSRGGRGRRDRGGRGGRNDRGGRSERSDRGGRGSRTTTRTGRRRPNAGANNQTTAYKTRGLQEEEVIEETRSTRRGRDETNVYDLSELQRLKALDPNPETHTGHVYNPSDTVVAAVEKNGRFVEVLKAVEDYSKHELKRSLLTHDDERRIVPLVSFKTTSDNLVAEKANGPEIFVEKDILRIEYPLVNFDPSMIVAATYPVISAYSSKLTLVQVVLQAKFIMPAELGSLVSSFVDFTTFDGWHKMLLALRDFATNQETKDTDALTVLTEVNRMDTIAVGLFNNYTTMLGYPKVKMGCFINDWPAAMKWLGEREQADLYDDFFEYEDKLFESNMLITLPKPRLVAGSETECQALEVEPEVPTFYVERSVIMVQYAGSIVGEEVDFSRVGEPCTITFEETPDFYTACNRLAKRRSGRFTMSDIYMTDSMGRLVVAGIRENNMGALRATMYR